jgi:hypothetical protein
VPRPARRGRLVGVRRRPPTLLLVGALLAGTPAAGTRAQAVPLPGLRDLPLPRDERAILFSSRDPSGGNDDHGHALGTDAEGWRILAAWDGPGRISRLWSANPSGTLRIELDGLPVHEGPFAALLGGDDPAFPPPLCGRGQGGGVLALVPLPFHTSCRVLAAPAEPAALYHQVGLALGPAAAALDPARATWSLLDPGFPRDLAARTGARRVRRGAEPQLLFRAEHPLEIVEWRVRADPELLAEPLARSVWIELALPGEERPSIQAPLGDLFGLAFDREGIETLAIHGLGASRVLRLPMPLPAGAELRAVPLVPLDPPRILTFDIAHRALPPDAPQLPLRAGFRRATNRAGEPFEVLAFAGGPPGHYLGAFLALAGASGQGLTFLEGDEEIAVDGEDPPAIRGTGSEDDLNGAWYFRGGTFGAPWHALATLDERRGRVAVARFRGPDPVPFRSSLRVRFEHGGQNDAPGSDYAATAFWYGGPPPAPVPIDARRAWALTPQAAAAPVELELVPGTPPRLDPGDPEQALLCGRRVLVEAPGSPPRLAEVDAAGRGLAALDAARVRISPWLDSIRTFRVAGPFRPATPRAGIDEVFGPERDASPDARYADIPGPGPRGWVDLPGPGSWTGYVDLDRTFGGLDAVVAYAACEVESPSDQDATLVLGSDDAVKVFVGGREVHRRALLRGAGRDQDRVGIRLRAGVQTLLIKVEDYAGGFGLYARFEGAEGLLIRPR